MFYGESIGRAGTWGEIHLAFIKKPSVKLVDQPLRNPETTSRLRKSQPLDNHCVEGDFVFAHPRTLTETNRSRRRETCRPECLSVHDVLKPHASLATM